jgi:hypothetical protein
MERFRPLEVLGGRGMRITYRTAVRNIRKLYAEIPQQDRDDSVNWYLRAHNRIDAIVRDRQFAHYKLNAEKGSHIVAALSPGCRWDRNIIDFVDLLRRHATMELMRGFKPGTYPAQAQKAIRILELAAADIDDWRDILKGPKERAFAHNLAYPEAERELTLDFHAYSIACNVRWTSQSVPQFRVQERADIDRAYRTVARENNLKACQLQAITWEWWRKTRPAPKVKKGKNTK